MVRIGITTSFENSEHRLDYGYVRAVERAGAMPIIVPVLTDSLAIESMAASVSGLLIPGGPAVTEGMTGSLPEGLLPTDSLRLASDKAILAACSVAHKPVLGICYGMQLMNAVAGGTIYADVQRQRSSTDVHSEKRGGESHLLSLVEGSHLHGILGSSELRVNTRHLQAIKDPGSGLRVSATGPDGVIEAIENRTGSWIGVQFHPERMGVSMYPLFDYLIFRASRYVRDGSFPV